MDRPLVSVVMPTFNHAAFIGDAIRSVLHQTHDHLELIIIDNYSNDRTKQVVETFHDERINYYQFFNNGIIAASRNLGIKKAHGELIAFIDSDDTWYVEKLARQIEKIKANPKAALCFCPFAIVSSDGEDNNKIRTAKAKRLPRRVYEQFINCNFMAASSVLVRTAVLEKTSVFDEAPGLVGAEDFDLWLRISRESEICRVADVQGEYRLHKANYGGSVERILKPLNVIDKHCSLGWINRQRADRAKANFYFREGWVFISKNVRLARSYFLKALRLSRGNLKIILLNLMGLVFSFLPALHRAVRRGHWDKRMGQALLNTQNL